MIKGRIEETTKVLNYWQIQKEFQKINDERRRLDRRQHLLFSLKCDHCNHDLSKHVVIEKSFSCKGYKEIGFESFNCDCSEFITFQLDQKEQP